MVYGLFRVAGPDAFRGLCSGFVFGVCRAEGFAALENSRPQPSLLKP